MLRNGGTIDGLEKIVLEALREDEAWQDATTAYLENREKTVRARLLAISPGILAGIDVAAAVFRAVDPSIHFIAKVSDGDRISRGEVIARLEGKAGGVLAAERVALNFLQRLSGISTLTRMFVDKISGKGVKILDTRKTTPLLRGLERYAVRVGGGENHRANLKEMVLIKENHIRSIGGFEALRSILSNKRSELAVEVEVDSIGELGEVLGTRIERLMLDNFSPEGVASAVELIEGCTRKDPSFAPAIEVSGGITLENISDYALPGVDYISVGALTHSAPVLDMTLEVYGG